MFPSRMLKIPRLQAKGWFSLDYSNNLKATMGNHAKDLWLFHK